MKMPRAHDFKSRLDILAPLSPTIAETIVKILQPIVKGFQVDFSHNCDGQVVEAPIYIPLRRVPDLTKATPREGCYRYVSAIAHLLSSRYRLSPPFIADILQSQAMGINLDLPSSLGLQLLLDEQGYLYFDLTTIEIAQWLEYLHQDRSLPNVMVSTPLVPTTLLSGNQAGLDLAIYARDRCRSLLRLAQSQKFIDLDRDWHISAPTHLFVCEMHWAQSVGCEVRAVEEFRQSLDRNNNAPQDTFSPLVPPSCRLFEDFPEQALIHALMDVLDGIYRSRSINRAKLAIDLAQKWLEFHRYCRMWGEVSIHHPSTAIARWGLTAIAGRYLDQLISGEYLSI
jgi:hypothetical protein